MIAIADGTHCNDDDVFWVLCTTENEYSFNFDQNVYQCVVYVWWGFAGRRQQQRQQRHQWRSHNSSSIAYIIARFCASWKIAVSSIKTIAFGFAIFVVVVFCTKILPCLSTNTYVSITKGWPCAFNDNNQSRKKLAVFMRILICRRCDFIYFVSIDLSFWFDRSGNWWVNEKKQGVRTGWTQLNCDHATLRMELTLTGCVVIIVDDKFALLAQITHNTK